ncbi:cytochrome B [Neolewinella lacunae]|uniref:Cytochrome B n=1 Tax=Neolewinella lacunae TaxID=1517758 RepID=A0A923T8V5_9BACT|nr:cytochrome B [Neolewinella lacunae]MBC6994378.1 cytochrome B [Neolewinella lacunae]MDN3633309.1 cytochrome B [Neolewinella lacunae]
MDTLYTILKHAHSGLRWVVLFLLLAAIANAFSKRRGGSVYPGKEKLALYALMSVHIQLILGLVLYLWLSPLVSFEGEIMSNAVTRFYTVEHLVGMLAAIALVTVGYSKAKRQKELNRGWKTIGVYYLLGLLLILLSIPWPFRAGLVGGWF